MIGFSELRIANGDRARERNPEKGVHVWTPTEWLLAMIGEAGEACNIGKKLNRIDIGDPAARAQERSELQSALANEIADVVIYCDLLAQRLHIDLGAAVMQKFNDDSIKLGMKARIV